MQILRMDRDFIEIYNRHVDTVYRVCYSFMRNRTDTEDIVQETFLKLLSSKKEFESESHEKAWLIVTASNLCKDSLKHWWRNHEDIDELQSIPLERPDEHDEILEAILELPYDYKTVIYMYYYEGYSTAEIAKYLKCPHSTVRNRLSRARAILKNSVRGELRESY